MAQKVSGLEIIKQKKWAKNMETEKKIAHKNRVQKYRSNISRGFALATRPWAGYSGDSTLRHTTQSIFRVSGGVGDSGDPTPILSASYWGAGYSGDSTPRQTIQSRVLWRLEPKTHNTIYFMRPEERYPGDSAAQELEGKVHRDTMRMQIRAKLPAGACWGHIVEQARIISVFWISW